MGAAYAPAPSATSHFRTWIPAGVRVRKRPASIRAPAYLRAEVTTMTDRTIGAHRGTQTRAVCKWMDSPVGRLKLVASDTGLAGVLWEADRPGRVRLNTETEDDGHPVLVLAERQLQEYFAGRRQAFTLPLDFLGTAFHRKVWN